MASKRQNKGPAQLRAEAAAATARADALELQAALADEYDNLDAIRKSMKRGELRLAATHLREMSLRLEGIAPCAKHEVEAE